MNIHPYLYAGLPIEVTAEMKKPRPKMLHPKQILNLIQIHFRVAEEDLITTSKGGRERETKLIPRQTYQYLLRKHTDLRLKRIGAMTNRNHASVIHSINKVEQILNWEKDMFHDTIKEVVEKAKNI